MNSEPAGGVIAATQTKFFKGSIGSALDLQMKLARDGDKLTGSYYYQKVGTKIDVRGEVDKDSNVTLEEFDASGKQTGMFKGAWKQDADGAIEISGSWNKPNSDKKTPFSLKELPIEFSSGAEFVSRQIKEKNKKLNYEVDAQYPQLSGSRAPNSEKFNQTVRSLITKKVSDFRKEMTPSEDEPPPDPATETTTESQTSDIAIAYEVALAKDDLIAIEFTVSSYSAGAAHPNSYTEVVNYDLQNGKLLKLADLFQPAAKYLRTLSSYCIQELKKQQTAEGFVDEDWVKKGAAPELTNYDNWTISKKGLRLTFDPYQVAAYAAGPQRVLVPYSALKEIIKPDGPVGQFVK
ncbi:MAG TPA: RsiV family protein [Pyrinomonadaceae bacterium]